MKMICKSSALLLTRRSQQRPHQPNEPIKPCRQSTVGILKRAPKAPRCAIQRIETNGSMDHFSYPMQMSHSLQWPFRLVFYIHTSIISGLCTPHVASLPPPPLQIPCFRTQSAEPLHQREKLSAENSRHFDKAPNGHREEIETERQVSTSGAVALSSTVSHRSHPHKLLQTAGQSDKKSNPSKSVVWAFRFLSARSRLCFKRSTAT